MSSTSVKEYKKIILEIMMENPKKLWNKKQLLREATSRARLK